MKRGGAEEKDGRDLRSQRPGKILRVADQGRDRHAVEGLEDARDRSIDGLCASRRHVRASGHRHLLLKLRFYGESRAGLDRMLFGSQTTRWKEASVATTERPLTITNKVGLHARPAALFVQTAARFKDTKIEVIKDGTVRDAKSMLGVLTLGVSQGTTITVRADGPHADEAIAALSDLVDRAF